MSCLTAQRRIDRRGLDGASRDHPMNDVGPRLTFRVSQIDHVELYVPDRYAAAAWYEKVLGLTVQRDYEEWAKDPGGPLMISSDDGNTKLALFAGEPQGSRKPAGFSLVAFRVDSAAFVEFLKRMPDVSVVNRRGIRVTRHDVVDHEKAYSIYFCDPYGHSLEITTYDYDAVKRLLDEAQIVDEAAS